MASLCAASVLPVRGGVLSLPARAPRGGVARVQAPRRMHVVSLAANTDAAVQPFTSEPAMVRAPCLSCPHPVTSVHPHPVTRVRAQGAFTHCQRAPTLNYRPTERVGPRRPSLTPRHRQWPHPPVSMPYTAYQPRPPCRSSTRDDDTWLDLSSESVLNARIARCVVTQGSLLSRKRSRPPTSDLPEAPTMRNRGDVDRPATPRGSNEAPFRLASVPSYPGSATVCNARRVRPNDRSLPTMWCHGAEAVGFGVWCRESSFTSDVHNPYRPEVVYRHPASVQR